MDNASKALIMAGGVLIAVMIIGVSMYILASARGIAYTANEAAEENARESFNRYYQSFANDSEILGIDFLNLCSKAEDDSKRSASIHEVSFSGAESALKNLRSNDGAVYMLDVFKYHYEDKDRDGYVDTLTFSPVRVTTP